MNLNPFSRKKEKDSDGVSEDVKNLNTLLEAFVANVNPEEKAFISEVNGFVDLIRTTIKGLENSEIRMNDANKSFAELQLWLNTHPGSSPELWGQYPILKQQYLDVVNKDTSHMATINEFKKLYSAMPQTGKLKLLVAALMDVSQNRKAEYDAWIARYKPLFEVHKSVKKITSYHLAA